MNSKNSENLHSENSGAKYLRRCILRLVVQFCTAKLNFGCSEN